jgi:NAD(P)-dependent dehydrogenase (short-subunit alcohol dehydrogenase family)
MTHPAGGDSDLTRRLAGEVAVVTGGSQGIGRAIVERLSAEGASIAILARNEARSRAVADEVVSRGGSAIALSCDVAKRDQVQAAVDTVTARFGKVSVLVNNAGIFRSASFLDTTDQLWSELLSVNLTGMFIVGQVCARQMARQGSGRIVNMSSSAAQIAHSDQPVYAASKAGIEALTRAMAFELAPLGIGVNAVAPGTIETSLVVGAHSEEALGERRRRIPLGRLGLAQEVAAVVAFLASRDASYLSGAVVSVDGGLTTAGVRVKGPSS